MESPTIGIARLLREGGRFVVPPHQRDYSWTEDEIEQFVLDIERAREADQLEYFVGLMVFMPTGADREYQILDGQQRLATTTLLLAGIRGWLATHQMPRDADQIQMTYVASRELGCDDYRPILVMNQYNNPVYERFVVRPGPCEDPCSALASLQRFDPSRRLLEAAIYCRSRIEVLAGPGSLETQARRLFQVVRFLEDRVKVVRLTVPSEANAYTVFETLNDRGLDLSVLDLVKNHLMGRAGHGAGLRDMQQLWSQIVANLGGVPADEFLKVWWTTRHGRVQTPRLFGLFKDRVKKVTEARQVAEDLANASETYASLELGDNPLPPELSPKSHERFRTLRLLGAQQLRPVLLAAVERLRAAEMERLLHLLEVLIVRYQLIGGGRTGRLEISCARLAHRIYLREISTASAARDALRDLLPDDEEFRTAFLLKQERNNQKARYLLSALEIQARRAEGNAPLGDELAPSATLTVEHIFPKNSGPLWAPVVDGDPSVPDECTYRLGNLCLLSAVNRSLGNTSFDLKRAAYAQSDLILTKEVAQQCVWNRRAIEQRQSRLATLAVAHWRV